MSYPAEQIRFCTSRDRTRIAYSVSGSGPPVVWLQHWMHHLRFDWDHPVWNPWLSELTRRHTLIRYDYRGCGISDREGLEFSYQRLTEDFEAVVEAAGFERFVLFAMGGCNSSIATAYAARHPERVTHLILHGGSARGRLVGTPTPAELEEEQTRYKAIEFGWSNDNPGYARFFAAMHIPDASPEQMGAYIELLRLTTVPANAIKLVQTFVRCDARDFAPEVRCPTLVLHSREDVIIPFEAGRLIAGLIPAARFVPLESRDHVLLGNEPAWQQFVDAFNEFLPVPSAKIAPSEVASLGDLTARENQVLEFLAQGLDNDTIAGRLGISAKTVRNQVSIIFSKLGVNSRGQAIVRARDAGFGRKTAD